MKDLLQARFDELGTTQYELTQKVVHLRKQAGRDATLLNIECCVYSLKRAGWTPLQCDL